MAFDATGAAVGGAGHDAAAIVAAFITSGVVDNVGDALDMFDKVLVGVFNAANGVKDGAAVIERVSTPGNQPSRPAYSGGNSTQGATGDPGSLAFNSGKKRGQTIADVYADDPSYIEWCARELKNEFMQKKCIAYLEQVAA